MGNEPGLIENAAAWFTSPLGVLIGGVAGLLAVVGGVREFARWLRRRTGFAPEPPLKVELVASPPPRSLPPPIPPINLPDGRAVFGREADVGAIRAFFLNRPGGVAGTRSGMVLAGMVLAGQGGLGKSTLARHYAKTHEAEYQGVLWVRAATRRQAIDDLCAACGPLGLTIPASPQESEAMAVVSAIARQAASGKPWLLVFDNVETREDIDGFRPGGAHIIVTTRQGEGWPGWAVRPTETLAFDAPESAAPRLLMQAAGREDGAEAARALAEDLGGLPLALVLMGAFLQAEAMRFDDGRTHLKEAMNRKPQNEGYPDSLFGAVRLSYERLSEDAKLVAQLCSFWAPEGLGPALIAEAPGGWLWTKWCNDLISGPVPLFAQAPNRIRSSFTELVARSLLTGNGEARVMHRMTALALREIEGNARAQEAVALLAAVYPGGERSPAHSPQWPLCARLTPHVRALLATGAADNTEAWCFLLGQASGFLDAMADYPGSLVLTEENVRLCQERLPETDSSLALAHTNYGNALRRLGRRDEALAQHRRAVDLHEKYRPGSHNLGGALTLLAGLILDMAKDGERERLPEAVRRNSEALSLFRESGRHLQAAEVLNNLSIAHEFMGQLPEAEKLLDESLSILLTILNEDDERLASGYYNRGVMKMKAGYAAQAETDLREAVRIRQVAFAVNPRHPHLLRAVEWLISCLLVRARAGVNRGVREAEAKRLCADYGFDLEERRRHALKLPVSPS